MKWSAPQERIRWPSEIKIKQVKQATTAQAANIENIRTMTQSFPYLG